MVHKSRHVVQALGENKQQDKAQGEKVKFESTTSFSNYLQQKST